MKFRFRKSFRLLPGLRGTISKKGVSLNFNAGIFSKTWGTRGSTTTIDMPGTSGFFWRQERRRRKLTEEERERNRRRFWAGVVYLLLSVQALIGLAWLYLPRLVRDCSPEGYPLLYCLGYTAVMFAGYGAAGRRFPVLRGPLGALLAVALFYVQFRFLSAVISPRLNCT